MAERKRPRGLYSGERSRRVAALANARRVCKGRKVDVFPAQASCKEASISLRL